MRVLFLTGYDTDILISSNIWDSFNYSIENRDKILSLLKSNLYELLFINLLGDIREVALYLDIALTISTNVVVLNLNNVLDPNILSYNTVSKEELILIYQYIYQGGKENYLRVNGYFNYLFNNQNSYKQPIKIEDVGVYGEYHESHYNICYLFYRSYYISDNLKHIDKLIDIIHSMNLSVLPIYCRSLRLLNSTDEYIKLIEYINLSDTILTSILGNASLKTNKPIFQGIVSTLNYNEYTDSIQGLSQMDVSMQIAVPEIDGRIITVPHIFKSRGRSIVEYILNENRTISILNLIKSYIQLQEKKNKDKKICIILSSYPTKSGRIGNAVGLDSIESMFSLLKKLKINNYLLEDMPESSYELIEKLIASTPYDLEFANQDNLNDLFSIDSLKYKEYIHTLSKEVQAKLTDDWGNIPGEFYVSKNKFQLGYLQLGNITIMVQPPRGFSDNPVAIYHDPILSPSYHYLASYYFLRDKLNIDAVVHLGKHGTLEWLPGKSIGLSDKCFPEIISSGLPIIYPFIVNDPGEGIQAKRRTHSVIIDHMIPIMIESDTYDYLIKLETLIDEYGRIKEMDISKLNLICDDIWQLLTEYNVNKDLDIDTPPGIDMFDNLIGEIDGYLCTIKDAQIKSGLHILGKKYNFTELVELIAMIMKSPQGDIKSFREWFFLELSIHENDLDLQTLYLLDKSLFKICKLPIDIKKNIKGYYIEFINIYIYKFIQESLKFNFSLESFDIILNKYFKNLKYIEILRSIYTYISNVLLPSLLRIEDEITNIISALNGQYTPSGPSGSPTRGSAHVLPTGRNFYSTNPKHIPSKNSYKIGILLANTTLDKYILRYGEYPNMIGINVWSTSCMRTYGDDISEILYLIGCEPIWDSVNNVTGYKIIPLEVLKRPRIDVVVKISGLFRDTFYLIIDILDKAISEVMLLDESIDDNYLRKHYLEDQEDIVESKYIHSRIYGPKPEGYGTGLLPLLDSKDWKSKEDIASVYENWSAYIYGYKIYGDYNPTIMERNYLRINIVLKNQDTREHDILDSDDYFQFHGGMFSYIKDKLSKKSIEKNVDIYIGDSSKVNSILVKDLKSEINYVVRTRVLNPKWIDGMMKHQYKGAFEMNATFDYIFGYDATTSMVDNWIYDELTDKYIADDKVYEFLKKYNKWALKSMIERLNEAIDRSMWTDVDDKYIDTLKDRYVDLNDQFESII